MEKKATAGIRYTKLGIVCMKSSTGFTAAYTRAFLPHQMPIGVPMAMQSSAEASTSASVLMLFSQ